MAYVIYVPDEYLDGLSLDSYLEMVESADVRLVVDDLDEVVDEEVILL